VPLLLFGLVFAIVVLTRTLNSHPH
jgi:hypothetical protein